MAILGIDFGSDTIKVVEMAKSGGRCRLLNYGVAPTPPNSIVDGDVRDPELVGEALAQLLKSRKIKPGPCVSSVQGTKSTAVRIIETVRMDKKQRKTEMEFELERHIPFAVSDVVIDYQIIDRPGEAPDSPEMEVLFAAVQIEAVMDQISALRQAKVKPKAIDVQPLALINAMLRSQGAGAGMGETVAIVNLGASTTDLCIVRDGLLHFPRTIPIAGRAITHRISEGLGVSEDQAERLKRELGGVMTGPPPPPAEPEPASAPVAVGDDLGFGEVFDSEPGDGSDVGFGGSGTGHPARLSLDDDSETAEIQLFTDEESQPGEVFELGDSSDDGNDLFKFTDDDTSHSLSPAPDDEGDDAPVPDDDDSPLFSFTDETDDTSELAAAADDSAAGAEEGEFVFGFGDETDTGTPEVSETAEFNFDLGEPTAASSAAPAAAGDDTSGTDIGSSFDLGELASETGGLDFDLGDLGEESSATAGVTFDDGGETPGAGLGEVDEASRVRQVMAPVIAEIAEELSRSLEHYRSRNEGVVIDRMVVVGGSSRIEGLGPYLETELGVAQVDIGDPLEAITVANKQLSDENLRQDAPVLSIAVGLALRQLL